MPPVAKPAPPPMPAWTTEWDIIFDNSATERTGSQANGLGLNEDSFCKAMKEVRADISSGQSRKLWQGFTQNTDRSQMDLQDFRIFAGAVVNDCNLAAQLADVSQDTWIE